MSFIEHLLLLGHSPLVAPSSTPDPALDEERLVQQLHALADPVRLEILLLLPHEVPPPPEQQVEREEQTIFTVQQLEAKLGRLSQPGVSHHLRILKEAGLVVYRKYGTNWYYYVLHEQLVQVSRLIEALTHKHQQP